MSKEVIQKIRQTHPFPWRQGTKPPYFVVVWDANGKEVPLLTIMELTCALTSALTKSKETA